MEIDKEAGFIVPSETDRRLLGYDDVVKRIPLFNVVAVETAVREKLVANRDRQARLGGRIDFVLRREETMLREMDDAILEYNKQCWAQMGEEYTRPDPDDAS